MATAARLLQLLNKGNCGKERCKGAPSIQSRKRKYSSSSSTDAESLRSVVATRYTTDDLGGINIVNFMGSIYKSSFRSRFIFDVLPIGSHNRKLRALKGHPYRAVPEDDESGTEEEAKYWLNRFRQKVEDSQGNRGFQGSIFIAYVHLLKNHEHM